VLLEKCPRRRAQIGWQLCLPQHRSLLSLSRQPRSHLRPPQRSRLSDQHVSIVVNPRYACRWIGMRTSPPRTMPAGETMASATANHGQISRPEHQRGERRAESRLSTQVMDTRDVQRPQSLGLLPAATVSKQIACELGCGEAREGMPWRREAPRVGDVVDKEKGKSRRIRMRHAACE